MTTSYEVGSFFCTQLAQSTGEQIYGSAAAETTVWLVLEYPAPWGAKAVAESNLPAEVKQCLHTWERQIPGARIQLIKQGSQQADHTLAFYVGISTADQPCLYRFDLADYAALLKLDLPAIVQRDPRYQAHVVAETLFLVCTNGKRDQCCAKWGLPVYQAMAAYDKQAVWQTTHTGGHRFSATLIALPHGIAYGWVEPAEVRALMDHYRQGALHRLDRYRGRTCYDPITQVADAFLREQTGNFAFAAYHHLSTTLLAEQQWQVRFQEQARPTIHALQLVEELSAFANPTGCTKSQGEQLRQYRLVDYRAH
jgi:hypothetical protein